ncbi:MAG: glycosyltransferase family 4 protein [Bacteroides sp.]
MIKQKVLFIMHMPPPIHGAAMVGQYIYDSKLINQRFDCFYINESISRQVSQVGKFEWIKIFRIFFHCLEIARAIRKIRPDLVYITPSSANPEIGTIRYLFEFSVINYFGCRKLIHFHNKGNREKCKKKIFRSYYAMLFKNAKVIFLSRRLESQYDWILDYKNILICPNGIPEQETVGPYKNKNNLVPRLLFLSNLIESKGVIVLLDALEKMKERGLSFYCDFVGGESSEIDTKRFENEVLKRSLNDFVCYHGKKIGKEKDTFFVSSNIFVFPTYYANECFPLVLLEAIQHGLPCVTTSEGGILDIIQDGVNGIVVESQNCVALADAISTLIEDPKLREKMGNMGHRMFKEKFTTEIFESRLAECIQKTIDDR